MKTIEVKIKNKPNEIKALKHLGKYSQHKPLFDEVVKTLNFIDELNKKQKGKYD
jgi:hypothetical protein